MSAYIVSSDLINNIVSGLHYHGVHHPHKNWNEGNRRQVGEYLHRLNVAAVKGCYPDSETLPGSGEDGYTFEEVSPPSLRHLWEQLSSLRYQCAEEPIYKTRAYERLDLLTAHVAEALLHETQQRESVAAYAAAFPGLVN